MKTSRWSWLVLLLCVLLSINEAFAAKRLGGGGSIGRQRDMTTFQRAPTAAPPAAVPPSAAPAPGLAPGPAAAPGFSPVQRPAPSAIGQRSRWLGPLAGFAGGALLGSLLFGHEGGLGGGIGNLLLMLLIGAGFIWVLRRFMASAPAPNLMRTEPAGWAPAPPPRPEPVAPLASAAPDGAALRLPPGFDLPAFLREARLAFVRLQAANDRADIADIREFTTPQMFAEISLQIQERGNAQQQVEIVALDAQLLDLAVQQDEAIASLQFHGTAREDGGAPESFSEIWHVRKRLPDPQAAWLLAGIQQVA